MILTRRVLILALILIVAGCQSATFAENFESIEPGLSHQEVSSLLGNPAAIEQIRLPEGAFFGPTEGLESLIKPGSPFEQWIYHHEGQDYYIWFAPTGENQPAEEWRVIAKANYPEGAVF